MLKTTNGQEMMLLLPVAENSTQIGAIPFATACSITKQTQTTEVKTKDHGAYAAQIPTSVSWSISTESLYVNGAYDLLNDYMDSLVSVPVVFGETTSESTDYEKYGVDNGSEGAGVTQNMSASKNWKPKQDVNYYIGSATISNLGLTANAGDLATTSIELQGNGPLKKILNTSNNLTDEITRLWGGATA